VLTAHHKGHFVLKACSISPGEIPSQACFDANPLEFVSDELYGAPKDVNFPERAYIAPPDIAIKDSDNSAGKFFKVCLTDYLDLSYITMRSIYLFLDYHHLQLLKAIFTSTSTNCLVMFLVLFYFSGII
jgi:hypothetical protein